MKLDSEDKEVFFCISSASNHMHLCISYSTVMF